MQMPTNYAQLFVGKLDLITKYYIEYANYILCEENFKKEFKN